MGVPGSLGRPFVPVGKQGFGFGEMTISVRPILSFASAQWLTSCARQSMSKIKPTFVVVRRSTNPPDRNQLRPSRLLALFKKTGGFHRMRENLIGIISALLRDLMPNPPDFCNY